MNFLRVRHGYLLLNPVMISSIEKSGFSSIIVKMADGSKYELAGNDMEAVASATESKVEEKPQRLEINLEDSLPAAELLAGNSAKGRKKAGK